MASTYTSNLAVEKPGSGDYVGTWNTPVNADFDVFDQAIGTVQVIDLSGGSVTLSTAQARSAFLNFTGALPSNVTVTIPGLSSAPGTTISGKAYTVQNLCSNTSAYYITLATTVAGQQVIAIPEWDPTDILIEGTNSSRAGSILFRNLGRIGTYWDFAAAVAPAWITACTVPPYLACVGGSFSSATYPALCRMLGGTTLPDARGRSRFTYDYGQARLVNVINGNSLFAAGGADLTTLSSQNIPPVPITITDPGHLHEIRYTSAISAVAAGYNTINAGTGVSSAGPTDLGDTNTSVTGISATVGSTTPTSFSNLPPAYVGGFTYIRAG